jgi:hypothetical protein
MPIVRSGSRALAVLALAAMVLHVVVNATTTFGIHRDELLYLAMGRHLRFWRMDFPPFIALVANATRAIAGDSLVALRLFPAVVHALLVGLTALLVREFGGGTYARSVAALTVLTSPLFLGAGNLLQPVVIDQLWWTLALFALVRIAGSGDEDERRDRWWLALGWALGLGLLTKFSIAFLGLPIVVAVLLTAERRWLATPWPWLALLLALAIGAPSITGQLTLALPATGQLATLRSGLARQGYARFIVDQLLFGPALVVAALVGLVALLGGRLTRFRIVGLACAGAFLVLFVLRGKMYYVGPIYPTLVAAGVATIDRSARVTLRRLALGAVAAAAVTYGVVVAPLVLPILSPASTAEHARRLGLTSVTVAERPDEPALTQDFADMLGWRELAHLVDSVYTALPAGERAEAVVVGNNYGEAGALEFHGRKLGLSRVVSPAGSMWYFGPGERPGTVLIAVGVARGDPLLRGYSDVREVARFDHPWMVREERNLAVLIARGPTRTLQALWPSLAGRN